METSLLMNLMSFSTPLLVVVALMLLVPAALASGTRLPAAVTLLGGLLLAAVLVLLSSRAGMMVNFTLADSVVLSMILLLTGLILAPLIDRARPASLMLAAPLAAYAILTALFSVAPFSVVLVLPGAIIACVVAALAGSALLPLHPARHTAGGQLRQVITAQPFLLLGWTLFAFAVAALLAMLGAMPDGKLLLIGTVTAALVSLLTARAEDGLGKAGEALAAAVLLLSFTPLTLPLALGLGLAAGFFVSRSEAISVALRIDDPHRIIGAVLLPAMLGVVMPGAVDAALLGSHLTWLGVSLFTGLALAALLWPILMLLTGFALPKRLVRIRA